MSERGQGDLSGRTAQKIAVASDDMAGSLLRHPLLVTMILAAMHKWGIDSSLENRGDFLDAVIKALAKRRNVSLP